MQQSGHTLISEDYLNTIWHKAEELVKAAGEIEVIGYSFDPNDRPSLMSLLRRSSPDCDIIIWNPNAEIICKELKLHYRDLAPRFKPLAKRF